MTGAAAEETSTCRGEGSVTKTKRAPPTAAAAAAGSSSGLKPLASRRRAKEGERKIRHT